jgi:two-component system response regulator HydG
LLTGQGNLGIVTKALRIGARDFLTKPIDAEALVWSVARALGSRRANSESVPAAEAVVSAVPEIQLRGAIGQSPAIRRVYQLIAELRGSTASVLLEGETGTGKELIARAIHDNSRFKRGPFVALNCAAMPAGLLETELFGHARGAFTDARTSSKGLLLEANGGTLLLDEIGELPLPMQPKLLRALQERTVRPVGQHEEIPFDCRLITATNRDLGAEVAAKRFREDLFYRLDVVRITVPPLRERGEDILLIAQHFVERFAQSAQRSVRLSDAVASQLLAYEWPGNVRELENCIERAVALSRSDELAIEELPDRIRLCKQRPDRIREGGVQHRAQQPGRPTPDIMPLFEVERSHILGVIELLGGNKTLAADVLGVDRRTLHRRLKRYESNLDPTKSN